MSKKLCLVIDPGHSPYYNKGINPDYYEGNQMWKLANFEKEYCDAYYSNNMDCVLTRTEQEDPSLASGRGMIAVNRKLSGAYERVIFMSDHSNAPGGYNPNVRGVCIYTSVYRRNTDDFTVNFGKAVGEFMGTGFNYYDRQLWTERGLTQDYWGVVRGAMNSANNQYEADTNGAADVAFIIEHGFHTNMVDCNWLLNDDNLKRLAKFKIDYLCNYYNIPQNGERNTYIVSYTVVNGTLTMTYTGDDGINVHSTPSYSNSNICYVWTDRNQKRRVINKVTLNTSETMYVLEDGTYVTTHGAYVGFEDNLQYDFPNKFVGTVRHALTVKLYPSHSAGDIIVLEPGNLFDVVQEAYNGEGHWWMVKIENSVIKCYGYIHENSVIQV